MALNPTSVGFSSITQEIFAHRFNCSVCCVKSERYGPSPQHLRISGRLLLISARYGAIVFSHAARLVYPGMPSVFGRKERSAKPNKMCRYTPKSRRRIIRLISLLRRSNEASSLLTIDGDPVDLSAILGRLRYVEEQLRSQNGTPSETVDSPARSAISSSPRPSLQDTLALVRKKKLQSLSHAVSLSSALSLDANDARTWIASKSTPLAFLGNCVLYPHGRCSWLPDYFAVSHNKIFLRLVNRKLIEMVPDLVSVPQVHLDASILVMYYGILFRGCAIPDSNATRTEHQKRHRESRKLYAMAIRALPLWQREATGSPDDFIAAVILVNSSHSLR